MRRKRRAERAYAYACAYILCVVVRPSALLCALVRARAYSLGSSSVLRAVCLSQFPPGCFLLCRLICISYVASVSCDVMRCVTCAAAPAAFALPHTVLVCTCCRAFHPIKPCHVAGGPLYASPPLAVYANAGGACLSSPSLGSRAEMCKPALVVKHSPFSIPFQKEFALSCFIMARPAGQAAAIARVPAH